MTDAPADRLKEIHERITKAAERSGRPASAISLVAVTKTVSLDRVIPFLDAGILHIGENRVQEALSKYGGMPKRPTTHLIGQLQSNKAKKAVSFFDVIQSVDRIDLARDLDRHANALGKKQKCFIEVKVSPEATKSGLPPEQLADFLAEARTFPNLELRGLMGIAPATLNPDECRPFFSRLRQLFDDSKLDHLSMGMSSDFEIAIEEGATMIRLGTILFGAR